MLDLAQVRIRIALVHQRIQVFRLFLQHEVQRLLRMILAVELRDRGIGISPVIPELLFGFSLLIASGYKIIPIVEFLERGRGPEKVIHCKTPTLIMRACGERHNRVFPSFFERPRRLLPAMLLRTGPDPPHREPESAIHAERLREDSSTAETNRMPSTPSAMPGTRRDCGSGGRPSRFAVICSAKSL